MESHGNENVVFVYSNPCVAEVSSEDYHSTFHGIEVNENDLISYDPESDCENYSELMSDAVQNIPQESVENVNLGNEIKLYQNDLICYDPKSYDSNDKLSFAEGCSSSNIPEDLLSHQTNLVNEIDSNQSDLICYDLEPDVEGLSTADLVIVNFGANITQESVENSNLVNGIELNENNVICYEPESNDENEIQSLVDVEMESIANEAYIPEVTTQSETGKGRPKRGRKQKVELQSRADRKRLCNTNQTYVNSKGNVVEAKKFVEDFVCPCPMECTTVVSLELRKRLFSQFYSMGTFEGRCALLLSCVTEVETDDEEKPRAFAMFGRNVCKNSLLRTLQINQKRIKLALKKRLHCDTLADCRGKNICGANAFPPSKREEVRAHIASFPKYISHYARNQTESKFLKSGLNLAEMYRVYHLESADPVSEAFYKRVFYDDFNLRFKEPKKDTCYKCDFYHNKIKSIITETQRQILEEWHTDHIIQADLLRTQMNNDLALAKIDTSIETLSYDQQKTHSFPKMPTSIVYYKRQLNLYNCGIHVGSSGKGIFNIWIETEASKGTQEVGSCLKKHINNINGPKKLILWSDSCGGQNRSIKLVLMLIHILQNHASLESISLRFLETGHSFLPNDSEFGDVECVLKNHDTLYTDSELIKIMENCRQKNKFVVYRMSPEDFFSVKKLENMITNRKVDMNKEKINWLETHEILIDKSQPTIIKMKKKIDGNFQSVNIEKGRYGSNLDIGLVVLEQLYPDGKPLSKEKVKDLRELLSLVPDESKYFYEFLKTTPTADFIDDVDGFGQSIDFELEHCNDIHANF